MVATSTRYGGDDGDGDDDTSSTSGDGDGDSGDGDGDEFIFDERFQVVFGKPIVELGLVGCTRHALAIDDNDDRVVLRVGLALLVTAGFRTASTGKGEETDE